MSSDIPKHRPRLATLTEAINILRDILRNFFSSAISKEIILEQLEPFVTKSTPEKIKFEKCKRGEIDIRNILDINAICQSGLINQTRFPNKVGFSGSIQGMDTYRNRVCHPDFEDIPERYLKKCLKRIYNLLGTIGKTEGAQVVYALLENPYTESHYNYHTARTDPAPRSTSSSNDITLITNLAIEKGRREGRDQARIKLKNLEKERDKAIKERDEAIVEWQQAAAELGNRNKNAQ